MRVETGSGVVLVPRWTETCSEVQCTKQQMYCSSAVVVLITITDSPLNEQDSIQTEAAVGNILTKWGVRGLAARK